jgi:hypothetical protein
MLIDSIPHYPEKLASDVLKYRHKEDGEVNFSVDCGMCGFRCNAKPRKDRSHCPKTLYKNYPATMRLIFKKINLECKRACNLCWNLLQRCLRAIPEDDLFRLAMSRLENLQSDTPMKTTVKTTQRTRQLVEPNNQQSSALSVLELKSGQSIPLDVQTSPILTN